MAIESLDGYIAAQKQKVPYCKIATTSTVANNWFSLFDLNGSPSAGVLAGSSAAAGVVPTDATAGCFPINSFLGSEGYLSRVEFASTVACRIAIFDMLFKAGAYAFNANTNLTGQPSFAGRVPDADYKGLEIWVEQVTNGSGNQSVNVTYTDQDGNGGATTGATGVGAALIARRCFQLPFASGDSGVQLIENVTGTVASGGTFNVLVLRPLWSGRVPAANFGDVHDFIRTGMPRVFADSALFVLVNADSTSSGVPEMEMEVAS